MKLSILFTPAIPCIRPEKKDQGLDRVGTVHNILLKNRNSTTGLLERLTGAAVAAESCNLSRNDIIFRSAVLTGKGRILVFARSIIDSSLLSRPARLAVLTGEVPLGKIMQQQGMKTDRRNFTFFFPTDLSHFLMVYRDLASVSPSFRQWSARHFPMSGKPSALFLGGLNTVAASKYQNKEYSGRSYDIFFQSQRLASIEEIFSPDLEYMVLNRFPG
jgi:chorismate-pyruvate lyase